MQSLSDMTRLEGAAAGAREELGQGIIELLISLVILAVGVGALLSVMAAGALSLQRSDQKGTALTLAENQLELYRGVTYPYIRLSASSWPSSGSIYVTANSGDATIPPGTSTSEVLDSPAPPAIQCTGADLTALCLPVQTVTGPDHRRYEIDTYVTLCPNAAITSCPATADPVKQVFVVVRDADKPGLPVVARNASIFSSSTIATG
jgi:type II secretory pathway pseudopilin PulG